MNKMEDLLWINGKYDLTDMNKFPMTWSYALMRESGHSTYYMSRVLFFIIIYYL